MVHVMNTATAATTDLRKEVSELRSEVQNLTLKHNAAKLAREDGERRLMQELAEIHGTMRQVARLKRSIAHYVTRAESSDDHGLLAEVEVTQGAQVNGHRLAVDDMEPDEISDILDSLDPSLTLEDALNTTA